MKEILVTDRNLLKELSDKAFIKWPILVNWPKSKTPYPAYVDETEHGYNFVASGKKYKMKHVSGCFFPFLYEIKEL